MDNLPEKSKSISIWFYILMITVMVIVLYFGLYLDNKNNKDLYNSTYTKAYGEGYKKGIADTVGYIAYVSSTCDLVPLNVSGTYYNLILVDCLKGGNVTK